MQLRPNATEQQQDQPTVCAICDHPLRRKFTKCSTCHLTLCYPCSTTHMHLIPIPTDTTATTETTTNEDLQQEEPPRYHSHIQHVQSLPSTTVGHKRKHPVVPLDQHFSTSITQQTKPRIEESLVPDIAPVVITPTMIVSSIIEKKRYTYHTLPPRELKLFVALLETIIRLPVDKEIMDSIVFCAPAIFLSTKRGGANSRTQTLANRMAMFIAFPEAILTYVYKLTLPDVSSDNNIRNTIPFDEDVQMDRFFASGQYAKAIDYLMNTTKQKAPVDHVTKLKLMKALRAQESDIQIDSDSYHPFQASQFSDKANALVNSAAVIRVLQKMPKGKSPTLSGWSRECMLAVLRAATPLVMEFVTSLLNRLLHWTLPFPLLYLSVHVQAVPVIKKQDQLDYSIRPVTCQEFWLKLLWRMIIHPLASRLGPTQYGTASRGCDFAITYVTQLLKKHDVVHVDVANAFPSVSRQEVAFKLGSDPVLRNIYWLFDHQYARSTPVSVYEGNARKFSLLTDDGLLQGGVEAAFCFCYVVSDIRQQSGVQLLQIVDDIYAWTEEVSRQQQFNYILNHVSEALLKHKLAVNTDKTVCMKYDANCTYEILGAMVSTSNAKDMDQVVLAITEQFDAILHRLLDIKMQYAWFIYNKILLPRYIHVLKNSSAYIAMKVARHIDIQSVAFVKQILSLTMDLQEQDLPQSVTTQIFTSCASAGLGVLNFRQALPSMRWKAQSMSMTIHQASQPEISQQSIANEPGDAEMTTEITHIHAIAKTAMSKGCFLTVIPTDKHLRLTNVQFSDALQFRLRYTQIYKILECTSLHIKPTASEVNSMADYIDHITLCQTCSAVEHWQRHEAVNKAVALAFSEAGLLYSRDVPIPVKERPRQQSVRIGPDGVLVTGMGNKLTDVFVYHQPSAPASNPSMKRLIRRRDTKLSDYSDFSKESHVDVELIEVSQDGMISPESLNMLKQIAGNMLDTSTQVQELISRLTRLISIAVARNASLLLEIRRTNNNRLTADRLI